MIARSGTVSAQWGPYGSVEVPQLVVGDVVRLIADGASVTSATYDGLPTIADACAGRSSFTGARTANVNVFDAGIDRAGGSWYAQGTRGTWDSANPFTVTLPRALVLGDLAYVVTTTDPGPYSISSTRRVRVGTACPPAPPTPPAPPSPTAPTDAQVLAALTTGIRGTRSGLGKLTTATLAKRKAVALPFAFSEAGTVKLRLTAKKGKKTVTLGTGSRKATTAGKANVSVKLSKPGRKLLRTSRKLKVTLTGTFTPARAGAKAQKASVSATLKRKR